MLAFVKRQQCTVLYRKAILRTLLLAMSSEPPAKKAKVQHEMASQGTGQDAKIPAFVQKITNLRENTATSVKDFKFNKKRVRVLSDKDEFPDNCKGIVYWMSRDQRVQDNWAVLYAQKLALKLQVPLHICFCLVPKFLEATERHYGFMLKGLKEVEQECQRLDISFHLLIGHAKDVLPHFVEKEEIGGIVVDFSPLRVPMQWQKDVVKLVKVPICQVDAHNIVPCWEASPKLEYGARTIRKKIMDQLSTYMTEFPPVVCHPHKAKVKAKVVDWEAADRSLEINRDVKEVSWATPGTTGGLLTLDTFIQKRLKVFNADRNNPNKQALSDMSPWYHFGQVSVQRAMLMVREHRSKYSESVAAYIEEGVVRRELADNFCYYNANYDNIQGAYEWARKTLNDHKKDKREYLYSREKLETAKTHDHLWNAAQKQLVQEGKMHGFLRMYWAKKILEWTESPEKALEDAIYLNDKYSLDGRDPNGYVGCMWSICGIHDQGWAERPVFGKIRFMNYKGCKRKFDVSLFEQKYKRKVVS